MNTMLYERTSSGMSMDGAGLAWRAKQFWRTRGRKAAPLTAIVAVHGVLFWMMSNGMLNQAVQAVMPKVVNVSFVASPEPLKPEPTPPKTVPVVTKVPTFIPPMPVLPTPQTQPTITVAPPTPRTSEPSTPVATAPVSAPTPAPAAPAAPKTITGVEYIRAPQPVYPNIARRMGESGVVLLRVLIGEKGQAEQVVIQKSSGSTNLDEAGRQAVLRALYKPYIEDGKAIPVYALVPINFQLG
ncbi:MAG: TonB family protein [Duganella sp.]